MENNNTNNQQTNWQQALNEFSDQPEQQAQPQQFAQQAQAQQFAQQAQPQQFAQQAQPQQFAQQAQAQGQFTPQGMPAYDAGNFAVVPPQKKSKVLPMILIILAVAIVAGGVVFACLNLFKNKASGYEALERNYLHLPKRKPMNY